MTTAQNAATAAPSRIAPAERVEECRAKAGLFRLLGRVLEAELDGALLADLRGPLREPLEAVGAVFDEPFFTLEAGELLECLSEEFTGLMVAPGGVSPYASVFETGRMFQAPADRAERAYREAGLRFVPRMSGEFADHIGTMLGFVGTLFDAEAEALERAAPDQADRWRERRTRFLLDELGGWAPGWCRRARAATQQLFYARMVSLAEDTLWSELLEVAERKRIRQLVALNRRAPVKLDYDADFRKASGL